MSDEPTWTAPDWERDGVAMDSHNNLVIRDGKNNGALSMAMTPMAWVAASEKAWKLEAEVSTLKAKLRYMTPPQFVPEMIERLDSLRRLHERNTSELSAGTAMAYAHAAAMLREAMK